MRTGMTAPQIVSMRESLGMSRKEFAALLGVVERTVYRWETGETKVDRFKELGIHEAVERLLARRTILQTA